MTLPRLKSGFTPSSLLGAFPSPDGTLFRLWAPTAEQVVLRLYPAGDGGGAEEVHPLLTEGGGTWVWGTDRDLKEAVAALHRAGFRVIMDVVHNHTYRLDSWLWRMVPWYYYRQRPDGTSSDGSACGNDLASERSMCARYIRDSVLFWAEEYHMAGFRFDLMGLLDVELMESIRAALDERFGQGEKLLYGGPWTGGETHPRPGTLLADKHGYGS